MVKNVLQINASSDRVLKTVVSIDIVSVIWLGFFSEGAKFAKNETVKKYCACVFISVEKFVPQSFNNQHLSTHMALFKGFSNAYYNAE